MRAGGGQVAAGAAAVLVAAVGAAAGCAAWQEPAPAAAAVRPRAAPEDADLGALIPAGAETIMEIDMQALRASPWTQPALAAEGGSTRAGKIAALGYDDLTDADRVVYAVPAAGADLPTLVLTTGRFDRARIEDAFRARHAGAVTVDGWRGITLLASGESALAVLTSRTFAAGPPAAVRAAIDLAFGVGAASLDTDPALGPIRRELAPRAGGGRRAPALLVSVAIGARMRDRVGDAFPLPRELGQVVLRLDLGETLDIEALGVLQDRVSAEALARRLRALLRDRQTRATLSAIGLGALLGAGAGAGAAGGGGLRVAAEGARVRVALSVAEADREGVAGALRALGATLRGR